MFKVLHNVIVCTCIWRGVGKGIKGFSQLGHILSMIIEALLEADSSSHKYPISAAKTGMEQAFSV